MHFFKQSRFISQNLNPTWFIDLLSVTVNRVNRLLFFLNEENHPFFLGILWLLWKARHERAGGDKLPTPFPLSFFPPSSSLPSKPTSSLGLVIIKAYHSQPGKINRFKIPQTPQHLPRAVRSSVPEEFSVTGVIIVADGYFLSANPR